MVLTLLNKCFVVIVVLTCGVASEKEVDRHIRKLYNVLKKSVNEDHNNTRDISLRRIFVGDSEYQIHINKLKAVNGFKMHNIVIRRPKTDTTIYITNPLESKFPHPFMSLEEFKNSLLEQQLKNRALFEEAKLGMDKILRSANETRTTKFKFTSRAKISSTTHKIVITTKKIKTKADFAAKTPIENRSKTISTKILTRPKDIKNHTETRKAQSTQKISIAKNKLKFNVNEQTVNESLASIDNYVEAKVKVNTRGDNNKNHEIQTLSVDEEAKNKTLVSSDVTAKTKVKVNAETAEVAVNVTNIQVPGKENNTASAETFKNDTGKTPAKSQKTNSASLDKVVPEQVDKDIEQESKIEATRINERPFVDQDRKQTINSNDDKETVILKETALANATDNHILEQENKYNTGLLKETENNVKVSNNERISVEQGQLDGKPSINNDEGINAPGETTPEPSTTTTTLAPTTRAKWKTPRVFAGK